jgi:hypothetical protein
MSTAARAGCRRSGALYNRTVFLLNRTDMPLLADAAAVFALAVIASLVGARIGRGLQPRLSEAARFQLFGIEGSLLGLLALLLGFSFGMGQTRYDARRLLLVNEANAIGTSWLRTAAAPEPAGSEIRALLEKYVESRLAIARTHDDAAALVAVAQSERLQREVWSRAASLARSDPRSIPDGLLLQSLNEMIDLHAARLGAARNHIPPSVLAALLLVAIAAMGWVGAGIGSTGRRGMITMLILSALIAFVISVIVDLDQPRAGFIRVSQAALLELQRTFE